jgi:hypothetical protein
LIWRDRYTRCGPFFTLGYQSLSLIFDLALAPKQYPAADARAT